MLTAQLPAPLRVLLSAAIGAATVALTCASTVLPARADNAVSPVDSKFTIVGAGWGHGRGMSQYGAYGAASKGLDYAAIVGFYYPGTTLAKLDEGNTVRVWITADNDQRLHFRPSSGLVVSDAAGTTVTLPTGSKYTKWRISKSAGVRVLRYRNPSGTYVKFTTKLDGGSAWYVANPKTGRVLLSLPSGATKAYRGRLGLAFTSSGARTVNYLPMEDYLRSVVPAEMPASWSAEALKAQAVAARTYAARLRSVAATGSGYDLCDTSACQVYKGVSWEVGTTDRAIAATADRVLLYQGKPAMTEFSSSNGGWSAAGGADRPYLTAQQDPYDGVKRNQSWQVSLTSAKLAKLYPGVGTPTSLKVDTRDGNGTYGGRVETIRISGTRGSVTVTGSAFKSKLGLKERLFTVVGGSVTNLTTTLSANTTRWQELGGETGSLGAPTAAETDVAGGSRLAFAQADLWWSTGTGSHVLTGAVRAAYNALGGPGSQLGFPKTDVVTADGGTYADFRLGRITCPASGDCVISFG